MKTILALCITGTAAHAGGLAVGELIRVFRVLRGPLRDPRPSFEQVRIQRRGHGFRPLDHPRPGNDDAVVEEEEDAVVADGGPQVH